MTQRRGPEDSRCSALCAACMYDAEGLSRCPLAAPRPPSLDGALMAWLLLCTGLEQWYMAPQISARRAAPVAGHQGRLRRLVVDTPSLQEHGCGAGPGGDQSRRRDSIVYACLFPTIHDLRGVLMVVIAG